MDVVIVNQREVGELLSMRECIAAMERVFASLAAGECLLPLRQILWLPDRSGALGMMPSHWAPAAVIGLKAVTYFPGNEGTEWDSHQGAVLLYETERGRLVAIVDGTEITAIRTAAVSAVATRRLARDDASTLALIGSGVQARVHLEAMLLCRDLTSVRVCSRTFDRAQTFARKASDRHAVPIEPVRSVDEAIDGADIICTVTSSKAPVLFGRQLKPGVHVNAVGSSVATVRELDAEAVRRSRLFVDRRESAVSEAGDFVLAKRDGAVGEEHIVAELGELVTGQVEGHRSPDEITLFKSVGLAVEDLAAANLVYQRAMESGAGARVELGGKRHGAD